MNNKAVISAIMAMSMATSGFVFGQGNSGKGGRDDRDRGNQSQRGNDQGRRDNGRDNERREANQRDYERRDNEARQQNNRPTQARGNYNYERGAGPNHSYHRGDRISVEERHRQYVVDDWRGHNLSAPPRGYHWVQSGGDYLLVAVATGIILQFLLGN